jgi:hypothetical protein
MSKNTVPEQLELNFDEPVKFYVNIPPRWDNDSQGYLIDVFYANKSQYGQGAELLMTYCDDREKVIELIKRYQYALDNSEDFDISSEIDRMNGHEPKDEELDMVSYPEGWIEETQNFGKNGEMGPKSPMNFNEDSCSHGNHIMSSCTECNVEQIDYAIADSIIWDVLGFQETPDGNGEPEYSFAFMGKWIVVLIDKGDENPYFVRLKRGSDGKWCRGAMKSLEDLE